MKFKEVEVSSTNPFKSKEEQDLFLHLFSNVCDYAVRVTKAGDVIEEDDFAVPTFYSPAYLLNWKWQLSILHKTARGTEYPEREFVDFIFEVARMLGVPAAIPSKEKMMEEFEKEMKKIWKHPDTFKMSYSSGEYLSNLTHAAFEAWCAAKTNTPFPIRKVEQG